MRSDMRCKTVENDALDVTPSTSREAFWYGTTRGTLYSRSFSRAGESVGRKISKI